MFESEPSTFFKIAVSQTEIKQLANLRTKCEEILQHFICDPFFQCQILFKFISFWLQQSTLPTTANQT